MTSPHRKTGGADSPRSVLVASGGSSGSHLLAVLLAGRRPMIAGPELNLASRPDLFDPTLFHAALLRGIMHVEPLVPPAPMGNGRNFHLVPPMLLSNAASYGIDGAARLASLIRHSDDWADLVENVLDAMAAAGLAERGDRLIEHSPACAVSLSAALDAYPRLRAIHLVRDPRDAIASMMRRREKAPHFGGISRKENLEITARQFAALNAVALAAEQQPGYIRTRYEDLVRKAEEQMERLFIHLGVQRRRDRPTPALVGQFDKQPGWGLHPQAGAATSSIGRYRADLRPGELRRLEKMRFKVRELGVDIAVGELIERFRAD